VTARSHSANSSGSDSLLRCSDPCPLQRLLGHRLPTAAAHPARHVVAHPGHTQKALQRHFCAYPLSRQPSTGVFGCPATPPDSFRQRWGTRKHRPSSPHSARHATAVTSPIPMTLTGPDVTAAPSIGPEPTTWGGQRVFLGSFNTRPPLLTRFRGLYGWCSPIQV